MSEADFPYTNIFLFFNCTVQSNPWNVGLNGGLVRKNGFGHEKKLRWGFSTRVLNFVGGTKKELYYWSVFPEGS